MLNCWYSNLRTLWDSWFGRIFSQNLRLNAECNLTVLGLDLSSHIKEYVVKQDVKCQTWWRVKLQKFQ